MRWSRTSGGPPVAVDLGTSRLRVRGPRGGHRYDGASVIAVTTGSRQVVAVGDQAGRILGRTPPDIEAVVPLSRGVVTDFDAAALLLRHALGDGGPSRRGLLPPGVVTGVPASATEVQRIAAEEVLLQAGARWVRLLPKGMLAALGAGLPLWDSGGTMIVDIGAGTTEICAFAFGTLVSAESSPVAGDAVTSALVTHLQREHTLALSTSAAEAVKTGLGRVAETAPGTRLPVRGRDRVTDLPKTVSVAAGELRDIIEPEIRRIARLVVTAIGNCPGGVADDIVERGLVVTGGGALFDGLPDRLGRAIGMTVHLAAAPRSSVLDGAARWIDEVDPAARRQMLAPL
ncbi:MULTISPECIES: rod shape-determining protein [Streptomyces]|uniref:rod shape-determining protein n=1 Tax=Streptomyces TaxID=1883 RepID=UPI001D159F63|nr:MULTISPECIES: rod shape-determining protein [Streptomyces]MCC3655494.1 rod shape-determining protein [Streptomyces sp. S07_1.15]WSQ70188.1 rod shape-determining protein [Streptomyces xinghaiensis]